MSWVKLDDAMPEHRKFLTVGDRGGWLFVAGLCYCARNETDGLIPAAAVPRMVTSQATKTAGMLVEAGLWEQVDGGYRVHDYLDYQPSAKDAASRRDSARERQKRSRESRDCDGVVTDLSQRDKDVTLTGAPLRASGSGSLAVEVEQPQAVVARGKVDQDAIPDSLDDALAVRVGPVLAALEAIHRERGGNVPTRRGVGLALHAFPKRDHLAVAAELQHWLLAGAGQSKGGKDLVRIYRTFLDRSLDSTPLTGAQGLRQAIRETPDEARRRRTVDRLGLVGGSAA